MSVKSIERIRDGKIIHSAQPSTKTGRYECHHFGSNVDPAEFVTLDEVAEFLRKYPRSGVRMNPGWRKITKHVFIDGVPR